MSQNLLEKPLIASVLGNGSVVGVAVTNANDFIHQWASTASIVVVVLLNVSLILIAWRKDRREAVESARRGASFARPGCGRPGCFGDDWLPPAPPPSGLKRLL